MHSNDDNPLVASQHHKETSEVVAGVLQVESIRTQLIGSDPILCRRAQKRNDTININISKSKWWLNSYFTSA